MVRQNLAQIQETESSNDAKDQPLRHFGRFIKSGTVRTCDGRYINYGGAFIIGSQNLPRECGDSEK